MDFVTGTRENLSHLLEQTFHHKSVMTKERQIKGIYLFIYDYVHFFMERMNCTL